MSQDDVCGMLGRRRVPTPLNHPLPRAVNQIDRREFVKIAGVTGVALAAGTGAFGCGPTAPIMGSGPAPDAGERELALFAIDEAISAGAGYVDVRISRHWNESVSTREERITNVSRSESYGIGVRALVGGSWGFFRDQ